MININDNSILLKKTWGIFIKGPFFWWGKFLDFLLFLVDQRPVNMLPSLLKPKIGNDCLEFDNPVSQFVQYVRFIVAGSRSHPEYCFRVVHRGYTGLVTHTGCRT